jgi:MFS family permease
MTRLAKLIDFLGLRRSIVGVLTMVIFVGMGERMAERFLPVYIVALGGSEILAGLLNGMDNLLSALYSFPGGYLSDRLGIKRSLLCFNLLAMAGYLLVILIPAWPAVFVGSIFFLSWTAISLPATMDLVATVLPKNQRTMGVSMHSLIRRVPMAVGPIVGGAFIVHYGTVSGMRLAFGAALLLAAIAAVLQQGLIVECKKEGDECGPPPEKNPLRLFREMSPRLRNLLVSDILIRFCEQIPYAYVVLWAVSRISSPVNELQFGYLTAIEMATAVLVYIPVAWLADRGAKKPFVAVTFVFFTLFPLALLYSQSFWPLAAAFVLRGLKEFGEPTRKALIMDLAPEGRKAAMFGLYYLMRDTIVSVAAFGGAGLWLISPEVNFLTAFGFGIAGTAWFVWRGKE